jgi:WD40 repeat protein
VPSEHRAGLRRRSDLRTGRELFRRQGKLPHTHPALSPRGRYLAWLEADDFLAAWDLEAGREVLRLRQPNEGFREFVFSPDEQRLAAVWGEGTTTVWDLATGQETFRPPPGLVTGSLAFSPRGTHCAGWSGDGFLHVWDMTTAQEVFAVPVGTDRVWCAAFSPDGQRLAWGSSDGTVDLIDVSNPQKRLTLHGHPGPVICLAFSPDGLRLAVGCALTLKLWEPATGQEILRLVGPMEVDGVAFSPDGRILGVDSGKDNAATLWDATPLESP